MAKPTSSDMNISTLGAPCGARTGRELPGFESKAFSAIWPSNGGAGMGRTVRSVWAKALLVASRAIVAAMRLTDLIISNPLIFRQASRTHAAHQQATGRIERGVVKVNEEVEIVGIRAEAQKTTVTGVEMFRKLLDEGQAGENVGLLLRGLKREDVERGQVVCKPGSITPHTEFDASAYILSKDEGGRHTPFFNNYRPQFYFRTTDVTGVVTLPAGTEMVMPGDNTEMAVTLIQPIAMEEGLRFAIREGGRTVGAGRVTKIKK